MNFCFIWIFSGIVSCLLYVRSNYIGISINVLQIL